MSLGAMRLTALLVDAHHGHGGLAESGHGEAEEITGDSQSWAGVTGPPSEFAGSFAGTPGGR